jgi:hypothetical protein
VIALLFIPTWSRENGINNTVPMKKTPS